MNNIEKIEAAKFDKLPEFKFFPQEEMLKLLSLMGNAEKHPRLWHYIGGWEKLSPEANEELKKFFESQGFEAELQPRLVGCHKGVGCDECKQEYKDKELPCEKAEKENEKRAKEGSDKILKVRWSHTNENPADDFSY